MRLLAPHSGFAKTSLRWVGDASHEEDGSARVISDEEKEGMVGGEVNWRRRRGSLLHGRGHRHHHCRGRSGFGAVLVYIDVRLVDGSGDDEALIALPSGQVCAVGVEGGFHSHSFERGAELELL